MPKNDENKPSKEEGKASSAEEFIYEQIKHRYDFENTRTDALDSKASNLVGWVGLIISIMSAWTGITLERDESLSLSFHENVLLVAMFVFLVGSLFFSLVAFRLSNYSVVPEPRPFMNTYKTKTHSWTLRKFTATMVDAIENNLKKNNQKASFIVIAWALFLVGMSSTATFIIKLAFKLSG